MGKVKEQTYEIVAIDSVQMHPDNPRKNNIAEIRASIKQNGFYGACVVQKSSRYILAGNGRYLAAKNEGAADIPVIWLDVDDDRALRIMLVDNRTNDVAGYDESKLREMLSELSNGSNLIGTGYDRAFLDELLKGMAVASGDGSDKSDKLAPRFRMTILEDGEETSFIDFGDLRNGRVHWQFGELTGFVYMSGFRKDLPEDDAS